MGELMIDKNYPNSSFRYDFKVLDFHIEIAPMYLSNEKYKMKMDVKSKLFGCHILKTIEEINYFLYETLRNHENYN